MELNRAARARAMLQEARANFSAALRPAAAMKVQIIPTFHEILAHLCHLLQN